MVRTRTRNVFALLLILTVAGLAGCILSPTEEAPKVKPPSNYTDLTTQEDVVTNLVQSYKDHNIDRFTELLHPDYIWYNQSADVANGAPEFNTRDQDIALTNGLFLAADHRSPDPNKQVDRLDVSLAFAPWTQITELEGSPCEDCWQSTREYYITVELTGGTTTYIGNDLVTMTVVPITKSGVKHYYLRRMDDTKKQP